MSAPLLTTKLHIPPLRANLVPRPRLNDALSSGQTRKLTLVSAPAGFGKTTVLCSWLAGGAGPAAWLSLDKADNDPLRFWEHFIAALQTVCMGLGQAARESLHAAESGGNMTGVVSESSLAALINDVSVCPRSILLVLDDYHLIESQAIHEALVFLLEHQPANFHLLVAGRADPPWPLARLRAREEVLELREKDLRFTADETAAFLNHTMKLGLSPADVEALEEHTEGWIAGLQMAALSLRDRPDAHRFVADFTASNRFIFDYLIEEVLRKQPQDVQIFLLHTSILDRFCAAQCNALLERTDSQSMLENLDRANLFLVPLDNERRWFRYHHLFGDLLYSRLTINNPDLIPSLHLRASQWYEKNGMVYEAIIQALEGGDTERVARLVSENTLAVVERGELLNLLDQFENLPRGFGSRLWLTVAHAWAKAYSGQTGGIESLFDDAEAALPGVGDVSERQRLSGHLLSIRAYIAWYKGAADSAITLAGQALETLPPADRLMRGHVLTTLGLARQYNRDFSGAMQSFRQAIEIVQADGRYGHVLVFTYSCLTFVQYLLGRLHEAADACQEVLGRVTDETSIPVAGIVHGTLSAILLEWNQLDEALIHARRGLVLAEKWRQADGLHYAYTCLADVLIATGDFDEAAACNRKAKILASRVSSWYEEISRYQEVRLDLARGNMVSVAERVGPASGSLAEDDHTSIQKTLIAVLVAQENGEYTLRLVTKLLDRFKDEPRIYVRIKLLCLHAVALHASGRVDDALLSFAAALKLAEPEGFVRTILETGSGVADLLHRAVSRGQSSRYARILLAELEREDRKQVQGSDAALVEALSERELEVLRMLETSMDSNEIAGKLFIAVSTVRTHIKKIYAKLGVSRRMEALQRARELGLL